jgi:DNA (cytosine-5)-methyltransferase 1
MTDDETWVEADHANTINTFDVGDTRTTHAIVAHGVSASDDQVAGTLCTNSQGGQRTTDIAAAEVDRSPALTQIKSERGIHVTHTLTSAGHDASEDGTGRGTPIVAATLTSGSHPNSNAPGRRNEDDVNLVGQQMSVRRLTPTECERLMGWPDDWTAPEGIKAPDSKRYAACGDGIVSHVAYWIGCRIQMIEDES